MKININQLKLSKTKIILISYSVEYSYYIDVIEKYKNILIWQKWRKNNIMYLEYNYKNNNGNFEDDNSYNNCLINSINDVLNCVKRNNSFIDIDLKINNYESKNINLIQKIINLDYFSCIYFEKNFISNKINFQNLKRCNVVVYKNNYYNNSLNLPKNLEKVLLYNKDNINFIFDIPSGLKKICFNTYTSDCFNIYTSDYLLYKFDNIIVKKLFFVNTTIDIKNTPIFHDYDFLIIQKIDSNKKFIDFNNLPYSLKILHIHDKINQEILSLPNSLEELKINYFDKNLLENLPSTLKIIHLDFGIGVNDIDIFYLLPNSLEEIILNYVSLTDHTKIFDIKLPFGIKKISIQTQSIIFDFILLNFLTKTNKKFTVYKNDFFWKIIHFW